MESAVTAPVSGHIKRVVVQEGKRGVVLINHSLTVLLRRLHCPRRSHGRNCALRLTQIEMYLYCGEFKFIRLLTILDTPGARALLVPI